MSIYIGQTTNLYTTKQLSDRLVINPPINQDELNVIKIGTDIQLGSKDNRFLVFDSDNDKILDIGKNNITIDQPTIFNGTTTLNDVHIYNNIITIDGITLDTPTINLNNAISINHTSNIFIPSTTTFTSETSNVFFERGIKVNTIQPLTDGANIVIKNLILDDVEVEDAIFKNNILIDHSKLPDKPLKNDVVSFKINKNINNTKDFIQLQDNSKTIFSVAKDGSITVFGNNEKHNETNASLTLGSVGKNIMESFDTYGSNVATINKDGHMILGMDHTNIERTTSVITLHRRDTFEQNDILRDPICKISMDYDLESNKITENNSNLNVNVLEFYPFIDKTSSIISEDGYQLTIHWLPFRGDGIEYSVRSSGSFTPVDIDIQSRYYVNHTHYDLGSGLTTNSILAQDTSSNIRLFTEFHNDPSYDINILGTTHKTYIEGIEAGTYSASTSYEYEYTKYTCNIYLNRTPDGNTDNPVDDFTITFDLYWIYKRELEETTFNISYVDTNPVLVTAPPFIDCEYNGISQASILADGKIIAKSVEVSETLAVSNLDLQNIVSDTFNINGMSGNILHIYDKIDVGNGTVTISADQGIQLSQGIDIKNTFSSISFCNVDASHFKYSTDKTEILNQLYVGEETNTNSHTNSITLNGDIGFVSSTTSNLISFTSMGYLLESNILSYNVDKDITLGIEEGTLDTKSLSLLGDDPFIQFMNIPDETGVSHQQISFAKDSFINISVSEEQNKVSIGIPYSLIQILNNQNTADDWYRLFRDYTNKERIIGKTALLTMIQNELKKNRDIDDEAVLNKNSFWRNTIKTHYNHTLNTYGNIRFADTSNKTLLEVRERGDHEITHHLPTLNVFGNIRCRSFGTDIPVYKGSANDALEIVGTSLFHDKVFTIKGVSSLSDRKVKDDLQAIKDPLKKIKSLVGYTYNRTDINAKETGLIAQDVEKVLPEVITEGANSMKHIAYGNMMGLIVEAIKNIDERLERLENIKN